MFLNTVVKIDFFKKRNYILKKIQFKRNYNLKI